MTRVTVLWLGCLALVAAGPPAPPAADAPRHARQTLWEIGSPGPAVGEFALGLDDFHLYPSRFPEGPLYVVGRTDAQRDWAPVQPGPRDAWAGSRPHTFTVRFGLDQPAACRLVIDLEDAHLRTPPKLGIRVNDFVHEHQTESGSANAVELRPPGGHPQRIVVDVPASALRAGDNTLTITTLTGAWLVYDRVAWEVPAGTSSSAVAPATRILRVGTRPVVRRRPDGSLHQQVRVYLEHAGDAVEARVGVGPEQLTARRLEPGRQQLDVPVPVVAAPTPSTMTVRIGDETVAEQRFDLRPVRPWVVYVLHHTHLDIGYTHVQSEVEALQWRHLEQAVTLARATADYPPDTRFRWNPEGLWAVESYLDQATPEQRARLLDAVRDGSIGLDALYGNALTGLCRPEELFQLTASARRLSQEHGLVIDSAMISDVPGFTWGVVPALAHGGVKYFSIAPNRGHRIGAALRAWGDRPFYWAAPSGERKVLCWMAGKGYSWFHGAWRGADTFTYDHVETALSGEKVLDYLDELEQRDYPYDLVQLRYNIGSDNGPPDPGLSDFVRAWNEQHASPRLVITTTSRMCRALEARYGDELPVVRGDFTPYWEDGAASSARETAMTRAAAERLVQAEVLWSLLDPAGYPQEWFQEAWRNVLLYDEHTWGSWNSISEPEAEFTRQQWATKQGFARKASRIAAAVRHGASATIRVGGGLRDAVMVFNTCSWPRRDVVIVPSSWNVVGAHVRDDHGRPVLSQRLRTGDVAFLADVPALGAARFTLHEAGPDLPGDVLAEGTRLTNGRLLVDVDETTGAIRSLRHRAVPTDLVETTSGLGLNDYLYVVGRVPDDPQRNDPVRIAVTEPGPVVGALRVESTAPGCLSLVRELRLLAGRDRLEIVNVLDKQRVLEPEAVHFAFPLRVPQGQVRLDIAWGMVRPELDQLPGACRNHFTVQRWVDVSNDDFGVTLATIDAPLVEIGAIRADPIEVGWLERLEPSTTLYSYVMNNYWETNYLAAQEGRTRLRYALRPHGSFDAAAAYRFGVERSQPLIPVLAGPKPPREPPLRVESCEVVVTSMHPSADGAALMVRLFNASERPQAATLSWRDPTRSVWISSPFEDRIRPAPDRLELPAWGIVTLRCER